MKKISKLFLFILLAILICFLWSWLIEPGLLRVNKFDIQTTNWHKEHNNLKIAVLSDLHIGSGYTDLKKLNKIVKTTNEQKPDLIFILGDYDSLAIEFSKINKKEISKSLNNLKAKYGIYSVLGNHDYYPDKIRPILKNTNITTLENEHQVIKIKGKKLYILGIKDMWYYEPDVLAETKKLKTNLPTILLSHNPDVFPEVPSKISLTLAGHNHGGQIRLPFFGGLFLPSMYGQKYIKGHIIENNKHLFVSGGIGTVGQRLRFANVPEIDIINIRQSNKKAPNSAPKMGIQEPLTKYYVYVIRSDFFKKNKRP